MALTKAHNRMIEGAAVNVKDFGAVGDGVTDDTAAIQAAYNYFSDNNLQGTIYAPRGTYVHTGITTRTGVVLVGEGFYEGFGTTFLLKAGSNTDCFVTQTSTFTQFEGFKNLRIDGNKENQSSGNHDGIVAYWWDIANILENVAISDCQGAGIRFTNTGTQTGNVLLDTCIFNRNEEGAIVVDGPVDCLTMRNCAVEGNGGVGGSNIVLNGLNDTSSVNLVYSRGELRASSSGGGSRHVSLANCNGAMLNVIGGAYSTGDEFLEMFKIETSTARIKLNGTTFYGTFPSNPNDIVIRDNVSSKNLTYTDITSKGKEISWNVDNIVSASVTGSNPVLRKYLDGSGNFWTITGNNGSPEGVVSANVGSLHVRTSGGTAGAVYQKVSGSGSTGWLLLGRDAVINTIADGDGTPNVAGKYALKTSNTSATTISFFDGGIQGQEIFVEFNDSNTTVDFSSSNLKGNGGVDFVANQFASMRCFFDGARWLCTVSQS